MEIRVCVSFLSVLGLMGVITLSVGRLDVAIEIELIGEKNLQIEIQNILNWQLNNKDLTLISASCRTIRQALLAFSTCYNFLIFEVKIKRNGYIKRK